MEDTIFFPLSWVDEWAFLTRRHGTRRPGDPDPGMGEDDYLSLREGDRVDVLTNQGEWKPGTFAYFNGDSDKQGKAYMDGPGPGRAFFYRTGVRRIEGPDG